MTDSIRILLVEDDVELAKLIRDYLIQYNYSVLIETRGDTGISRIIDENPDLVILDLMLPGKDGHCVCRTVRTSYNGPILMLTAREEDVDQVVGLEIGADDYVKKPVEPRVLLARIRALLRRFEKTQSDSPTDSCDPQTDDLVIGSLIIRPSSQTVLLAGKPVELTTNEFTLLSFLAKNSGQVMERETLFKVVRGISYDGLDRTIDVIVSRLRKKLGDNTTKPYRIKTVWGRGYIFVKEAWAASSQTPSIRTK